MGPLWFFNDADHEFFTYISTTQASKRRPIFLSLSLPSSLAFSNGQIFLDSLLISQQPTQFTRRFHYLILFSFFFFLVGVGKEHGATKMDLQGPTPTILFNRPSLLFRLTIPRSPHDRHGWVIRHCNISRSMCDKTVSEVFF